MEFTAKKNNNATCDITLSFTSSEVESAYKKAYENAKAKVKVPGFRPGKAPAAMVEKILGESVMDDAANIMLNDGMAEIFDKLEPKPIRYPRFSVEAFDRKTGAKAKGTYDTKPEVSVPKLKKIKIQTRSLKIEETDIQKELETIQKSMARNSLKEESELVEPTDLCDISYRFRVLEEEDSEFPKDPQIGKFQLGAPTNPVGFESNLLGLKINEPKTFIYQYPEEYPQAPESAGKKYEYEINIQAIYKISYPAIDDDFASEYDGSENLSQLKDKIRNALKESLEPLLYQRELKDAYKQILEESKFVIPQSLVEEEGENVYQNFTKELKMPSKTISEYASILGKTVEEVRESFQAIGLTRIKTYVFRTEIAEKEKILISEEEVAQGFEKEANRQSIPVESFRSEVKRQRAESFYREKFLFDKVDRFIHSEIEKKSPQPITVAEMDAYLKGEETK